MGGWSFDLPRGEAERIGRLKNAAGGYDEMERLFRERRQLGPGATLRRDENGRLSYMSAVDARRYDTAHGLDWRKPEPLPPEPPRRLKWWQRVLALVR